MGYVPSPPIMPTAIIAYFDKVQIWLRDPVDRFNSGDIARDVRSR